MNKNMQKYMFVYQIVIQRRSFAKRKSSEYSDGISLQKIFNFFEAFCLKGIYFLIKISNIIK